MFKISDEMYPTVEASSGQEQYYIGQLNAWKNAIEQAAYSLTYPPVEASSGQKQSTSGQLYIVSFGVQLLER